MAWPMARMLASRLAWLKTTPFGSPVLPDVYWMSAVSASCVSGRPAAGVRGESPATLSIALRLRTCACKQGRGPSRFRNRYQNAGSCVAQDRRLAAQMLLQLGHPHRRIDRHWHRAGIEDGEKRNEEVAASWQHQRNPVTRHEIPLNQALRGLSRGLGEFNVGQGKRPGIVIEHSQVTALGMAGCVPFQHFHQRPRFNGSRHNWKRLHCRRFRKDRAARHAPVPAHEGDRQPSPLPQRLTREAAHRKTARS